MPIGSLVTTLVSGWTKHVRRSGAAVFVAAGLWGVAVIALGHAPTFAVAMVCLVAAGACDMVSALFRMTI